MITSAPPLNHLSQAPLQVLQSSHVQRLVITEPDWGHPNWRLGLFIPDESLMIHIFSYLFHFRVDKKKWSTTSMILWLGTFWVRFSGIYPSWFIWRFPKMVVPLNHPVIQWIVHYKPSSYGGTPMYGNRHLGMPCSSWKEPKYHGTKRWILSTLVPARFCQGRCIGIQDETSLALHCGAG